MRRGRRGDAICILHMRRADGCARGERASVFGNHVARRIDGDGILIIERLAPCLFFVGEIRRIRLNGDRIQIDRRHVRDGCLIHDAIPARECRTDAADVLLITVLITVLITAVPPCLFCDILRANGRLFGCRDGAATPYANARIRCDRDFRLATRTADTTRADRVHFYIFCIVMLRRDGGLLRCHARRVADGNFRFLRHIDKSLTDRTGNDAARTCDGLRVRIVVLRVRRFVHAYSDRERFIRRELRVIADTDQRFVLRLCFRNCDTDACDAKAGRNRPRLQGRCILRCDGNVLPMNGGLISYICLRCHLRRKRHARTGSGIDAKRRTNRLCGELRICFRIDLRLFLRVDRRPITHTSFRRTIDMCRDDRAIQSARQRNRCARELRIEASYIARGNSRLSAGRDERSRPRQRTDDALVHPGLFRPLRGDTAGEGRANDVTLHLVVRRRRNLDIPRRLDRRSLSRLRLRQGIRADDIDRDARRAAACADIPHDIGHSKLVIGCHANAARRDLTVCADLGERTLFAHIRRLALECRSQFIFHIRKRICLVHAHGIARLGLVDFAFHPVVHGAFAAILAGLAREHGSIAVTHDTAEAVHRDAARYAESAHGRRDGIRRNALHMVCCIDHQCAIRVELVIPSEEGIGLRANRTDICRRPQCSCTDRRACDRARHLVDIVLRLDRDIAAFFICLIEENVISRIRLGDSGEIRHIHCTRKAGIEPASGLHRHICEAFLILRGNLRLPCGIKSSASTQEGFRIFRNIRHADGCTRASTGNADGRAAIAAFERCLIAGRDRDPFCIRCFRRELAAACSIGFRGRLQHIDAHGAGERRRAAHRARDRAIVYLRQLGCGNIDFFPAIDDRFLIRISGGVSREGNRGIREPHADRSCRTDAARGRALRKLRIRKNLRALRCADLRALTHMRIGLVRHERLGGRARKTDRTACPEASGYRHAFAGILCLDSEGFALDSRAIPHAGFYFLIHDFDCCGETDTGISAGSTTARRSREFRFIFGGDRDITCIRHFTLLPDICFRIGRNRVCACCARPSEGAGTACECRRDGRHVFRRLCIHMDGRSLRERCAVRKTRVGVTVVGLDIDSCTEAATRRERHAARKAEELRGACRSYLSRLLPHIVLAFADGGIGGLVDDIHRDRAGARELRGAAGEADSDGLGCLGCLIAFGSVTVVGIVCFDGDAVRGDGLFLIRIARKAGFDFRLVHHDGDGCARGVAADGRTAHADGRIAAILGEDGERAGLHFIFIGNTSVCIGMDIVTAGRERTGEFTGSCPGCHDGLNLAGLIRGDGESAAAVHDGVFERRGGFPFDEICCDGSAHRRTVSTAGNRHRARIGVDGAAVFRGNRRRFTRLEAATFDVCIGGIIHPVQADLACDGTAFGRATAAGCDVCDLRRIVCFDGQRGIVFTACEVEGRIFGIGFILVRDGIVHEAPRDRLAVL